MPATPKVNFFFSGSRPTLKERARLKRYIISMFKHEKKRLQSITYIFSNDKLLLEINKKYLGHDYYTDIISFELSGKGSPLISEIYISCDRVKENALIHNTSFKEELHRVVFHGVLHLCGYNDKTAKQTKHMRGKEDHYLGRYFE